MQMDSYKKADGGDTAGTLNKKDVTAKNLIAVVLYIILYYAEAGSYRPLRNFLSSKQNLTVSFCQKHHCVRGNRFT
jgi:hypothetical protein